MREFHLGQILSITTGRLVAPSGIQGVYEILNYMTGDSLFTHQLPRAGEACKPALLAQHPQLAEIDTTLVDRTNWAEWLLIVVEKHGEMLPVEPLTENWTTIDPMIEAESMFPGKVLAVQTTK